MASSPTTDPPLPPVKRDWLGAFLSFLIPGLGQVYQGRVGKGLLFFGGLYLLFFYGMWMGQWRNVWLPDEEPLPKIDLIITIARTPIGFADLKGPAKAAAYRPQYLGQFWIGVAAWPALYQNLVFDPNKPAGPIFGKFERAPDEKELNDLQRNGNKRWDLGWVYTVIAGVLNLLVIYDALAGPMFREPPQLGLEDSQLEDAKADPGAKPPVPAPAAPPPAAVADPGPVVPAPTPPAPQQGGA